jgi:hypothetical protein
MYDLQREFKDRQDAHPMSRFESVLKNTWFFFVTPWFTLPLLLSVFSHNNREVKVAELILLTALIIASLYWSFFPHYIAAYTSIFCFLIVRGMMVLSQSFRRSKMILLFLIFGAILTALHAAHVGQILGLSVDQPGVNFRQQISEDLIRLGGRHVVFVRYGPNHSPHDEWVYNEANIDAASIVWCRATDPFDESEARKFFGDRRFWLAVVDDGVVHFKSYPPGNRLGSTSKDWVLSAMK